MNNINCKIVADSINSFGNRIITFELIYPRIIHAEVMTHRLFSRNASSSRAVPVNKMIEAVRNNMFTPLAIQKAHKGMQGSEYFEGDELVQAKQLWIESAELALQQAEKMEKFGITKQLINRILEPYQYYKVLITATEFDNFFSLRCPAYTSDKGEVFKSRKYFIKTKNTSEEGFHYPCSDLGWLKINKGQSEIHIMQLAECMWDAMNESTPKQLQAGEYHIPYGDTINVLGDTDFKEDVLTKIKIATARCARVSYTTVGEDSKEIPYEKDIALHDSLIASGHMSPTEHIARAMSDEEYESFIKGTITNNVEKGWTGVKGIGWCNNFRGFIQYRYMI